MVDKGYQWGMGVDKVPNQIVNPEGSRMEKECLSQSLGRGVLE